MGNALESLGRYDEALILAKEVFEKRKNLLGENHLSTIGTLNEIAWIYYLSVNFDDGLTYAGKLYELVNKIDYETPRIIYCLDTISAIYSETGKIEDALKISERIINIIEEKYHENSTVSFGHCYKTIGIIFAKKQDYSKAVLFLKKALNMYNNKNVANNKYIEECEKHIEEYQNRNNSTV